MAARATRIGSQQLLSRRLGATSRQTTPALRSFFTSTQPASRSRLPSGSLQRGALFLFRTERSLLSRRFRSLRFKSDKPPPSQRPNPTPHLGSPEPALSLSQRLKKLSREYGWSALGVYLALTALDFPFCFLAVRALGTDRIGHYEHVAIEAFWSVARIPFPNLGKPNEQEGSSALSEIAAATEREGDLAWGDEINQAEAKNRGADATIWTQLALAYVIHKSFIFIRVPITAAITPKVVKTLRGWGWNIGKRKPKST
ncbi:hypothetical protein K505DRAFT_234385 [Melanomma pulvis-pyrius CBS 109.77]|uniref:DUF1279 domain-containing protein n=1 Tax=Melanomma pulvis-pyrius CBS 109.77 TaxID=1314802 RepID=A0A6A6XN48_9PLEO|nr:hypothetical protein K505DRAFT_234385 [Melanomma pulvis-pyrius CBS 109.77]